MGTKFTLYARGEQTGVEATATFTDGNITFSTSGLPSGIPVVVNWSHTQGQGQSGTTTFTSPGPSASLGVNNQTFSYTFPSTITHNGNVYNLISSTPASGFNTGSGNTSIDVVAVYQLACSPAAITTQPANQTVVYGNAASFSVAYTGVGLKTLQWQVDMGNGFVNLTEGGLYTGVNATTLQISKPTVAMSSYQYRMIITGACGDPVTSNAASLTVNKKEITVSITASDKVYDGNDNASVSAENPVSGVISGDNVTATASNGKFNNKNVGEDKPVTADISLSGADAGNYSYNATATATADITQRPLTVTATGINKTYDGNATATVNLSTNKVAGDDVTANYTDANFADPNVGTWTVTVTGISITGTDAGNYALQNTTASTTAQILQASTNTTLTLSAASVRFMDNLTMTAVIVPANTATPLTGTVNFSIGGINYGDVNVVPVPGATNGAVQAQIIVQVSNMPGNYTATAVFTSTNANYTGSNASQALNVRPRNADPFNATGMYTGDLFAWTTSTTSNTATLTLSAVLKDNNTPMGDLRGARVTFFLVNGTTFTPIPSAQNLPVGLVDAADGSVGAASAVVQLSIGNNFAQSFQIAVGVSGAYTNNRAEALSQCIVTVSRPVGNGSMVGGGKLLNNNSGGLIRGHSGLHTDYEFDIQYTKSGSNPKGKLHIMVRSYYDRNGLLDSKLHTYHIRSTAISLLNVGQPLATATFSSKANLDEQLEDGSIVAVEGGATLQVTAFQNGCTQQLAITFFRKAGGIWFSSNWNATATRTILQDVTTNPRSVINIAGGGTCSITSTRNTGLTAPVAQIRSEVPVTAVKPLEVKVFGNPSTTSFALRLNGGDVNSKITLRITDMQGRIVEVRDNLYSGQLIQVGERYTKGVYFAEVIQGTERRVVRLMKIE